MLPLSVIAFLSSTLEAAGHRWPISGGNTTVRDIEGDARYRYRYRFVSQSSSISALRCCVEVAVSCGRHPPPRTSRDYAGHRTGTQRRLIGSADADAGAAIAAHIAKTTASSAHLVLSVERRFMGPTVCATPRAANGRHPRRHSTHIWTRGNVSAPTDPGHGQRSVASGGGER